MGEASQQRVSATRSRVGGAGREPTRVPPRAALTTVGTRRQRNRRALLVATAGLALTAGAVVGAHAVEHRRAEVAFEREARHTAGALRSELSQAVAVAHTLPPMFAAGGGATEEAFRRFADPILARHPSIAYLEWAPRVSAEERAAFEEAQRRTNPDFRIREPDARGRFGPAAVRPVYFPLVFAEPPAQVAMGLDVAFEPVRRRDIEAAVDNGEAMGSARFTLAEDSPTVASVAVYAPVYNHDGDVTTREGRRAALRGLAIEVFRIRPMMERALEGAPRAPLEVFVLEEGAAPEAALLFETTQGLAARADRAAFRWTEVLPFETRRWSAHIVSRAESVPLGLLAYGVLGVGLLLTAAAAFATAAVSTVRALRRAVEEARQYGQYRIVRKIGEGGMGTVYEASHALLRRPTALKLVHDDVQGEALARFEREVRCTSLLTHPNTVAVYDYGHTPAGVFYYAMEYLDGVTLEDLVTADGPQRPARVVHILRQVLGSLAEAHGEKLVHRDIKPSNIMLTVRGGMPDFVKVLDFGLVKQLQETAGNLSTAGQVLGTPLYMAPEALTAPDAVGPAADIYAVGAVAYFLLTGRNVFEAESTLELVAKQLTSPPAAPSALAPAAIPPALDAWVLRCLAKNPADRPESAAVAAAQLAEACGEQWSADDASAWWAARGAELKGRDRSSGDAVSAIGPTVAVSNDSLRGQATSAPR